MLSVTQKIKRKKKGKLKSCTPQIMLSVLHKSCTPHSYDLFGKMLSVTQNVHNKRYIAPNTKCCQ